MTTTVVADEIQRDHQEAYAALLALLEHLPLEARQALQNYYYAEWQRSMHAMSHSKDAAAIHRNQGVALFLESTSEAFASLAKSNLLNPGERRQTPVTRRTRMANLA